MRFAPGGARRLSLSLIAALLMVGTGTPSSASDEPCQRSETSGGNFLLFDFGLLPDPHQVVQLVLSGNFFQVLASGGVFDCGGSTPENTDSLFVQGTDGPNSWVFSSGLTKVLLDIAIAGGGGKDEVRVNGTKGRDRIYAREYRDGGNSVSFIDFNGDDQQPYTLMDGIERIFINGGGGNDRVGAYGRSTGYAPRPKAAPGVGPIGLPLTVKGGGGKDLVTGGTSNDVLAGGGGNDKLKGGGGKDTLKGGGGKDGCNGGPGRDKERGCE